MLWKQIMLILVCIAGLTACASSNPAMLQARAQAREAGLQTMSISGGACDDAGQFIPGTDVVSLEASAAPAH